jgi:hypothetical protein
MYVVYDRGASLRKVGEEFGISASGLGKLFLVQGLKVRRCGRPRAKYPASEMYTMYQKGATLRQVGEHLGCEDSHPRTKLNTH